MRQLPFTCICLLLLGSFLTSVEAADIYRWKDANGSWHYSDQPGPGAERVRGKYKPGSQQVAAAVSRPADSVSTGNAGTTDNVVAKQVRDEVSQVHKEQCKKATEAYQQSIQSRRLFREDAKGVRTYLTAAEITEAQLQARQQKDLACSP